MRGVAAIMVVLFHYTYRMQELTPYESGYLFLLGVGELGVHLFFVVSGFVIYMSLHGSSPFGFFTSRFTRIMPAFWFCATLTFAVKSIFGLPGWLPGRENTFVDYLINMTMLAGAFNVKYVDGVYWTLTIELWFYILVGIVYFTWLRTWIFALCAAWLGAGLLFDVLVRTVSIETLPFVFRVVLSWFPHLLIVPHSQLFIAGICLYHLWIEKKDSHHWMILLGLCLVAALLRAAHFYPENLVIVLWFALFWLAVRGQLPFLSWRPFVFFGAISYPLYLVHNYPGLITLDYLHARGWNMNLALLVVFTGATLVAWLVTTCVENPARPVLKRLLMRSREVLLHSELRKADEP